MGPIPARCSNGTQTPPSPWVLRVVVSSAWPGRFRWEGTDGEAGQAGATDPTQSSPLGMGMLNDINAASICIDVP